MSNNRSGIVAVRTLIGMLALSLVLVFGLVPASAAHAQSSPDDRTRFVSITRKLEETPLQADGRADRAWALSWLTEAPDVSVTVCPNSLGGLDEDYRYAGEITLQYVFAMAVLVIERPELADDQNAQQVAGVAGALRAYRAILGGEPGAKSPILDSLLAIEARGGLADFIQSGSASCSAET